jgi:hypothetical protein
LGWSPNIFKRGLPVVSAPAASAQDTSAIADHT